MYKMYDTIIIGAGIAGATAAYTLKQENQKVLVLEKKGIASGGSGAAGAFVSPKIGKGSALQKLTNEAFIFAKDFYLNVCPEHFHQTGVIRIPKDEEDAKKFKEYEAHNSTQYERYSKDKLLELGIKSDYDSFSFDDAGHCDAEKVCHYLLQNIEIEIYDVENLSFVDGECCLNIPHEVRAKNVIFATGYESNFVDMRYMDIKGTWGTRGDFKTSLQMHVSMHQSMSVGSSIDGIVKLGATHEKIVIEPIDCSTPEALSLKEKASSLIDTSDFTLEKVLCGMRSGSKDYVPLVGRVIDVAYMLETYPKILRGAKPELKYVDNIYVLNGLGGRGFVFAPFMAKLLADHIVKGVEMDKRVCADRLFLKWCRKL
jgi:tRNA 5-methylaminomethyl-2-thiouridine biosynthesis bifunctional protein